MIHIGVIGYGYWGPNIVRNLLLLPGARVLWICDLNPKALSALSQGHSTIKTTQNIKDILEDPTVDAVVIATPPATHFAIAKAAILAGKHVLVEKPMTTTTKEAQKLNSIAHTNKKILMVDHTFIYTPAIQKLKKIIDAGTLGKMLYVDSVRTNLGLFQKDSNVIFDLAAHDFSIMQYLFGATPRKISATGIMQKDLHQETVAYITARYPSDLFLHCHVSWLSPIKIRRMIIVGTKKMVVYDDVEPSEKIKIYDKSVTVTHDLHMGYRSGAVIIPKLGVQEALSSVVSEFIHAIRTNKPPRTDGTQGLLVVESIEAATTSLRTRGKTIKL